MRVPRVCRTVSALPGETSRPWRIRSFTVFGMLAHGLRWVAGSVIVVGLGCGNDKVRSGFEYGYRTCWKDPKLGGCLEYEALFRTVAACQSYLEESLGRRCVNGDELRRAPEGEAICWKQDVSSSLARGECNKLD